MNKTPIQELIWLMCDGTDNIDESVKISEVWDWAHKYLEKEKQFAFDCYTQGQCDWDNPDDNSFDNFYSQYAEQHKK